MSINKTKTNGSIQTVPGLAWRRILVPLDFSNLSLHALDVAAPLARDLDARLFLLSVIEPPAYPGGLEATILATPDCELVEYAESELPKIARRFVPPEVHLTVLVERGRAFEVITRVAQEMNIDLIVLASHGRTGLDRILLGSTAERVVRHAPCPVYVVRQAANRGLAERNSMSTATPSKSV